MGPFALFDEVGIDVAAHITNVLTPLFTERGAPPANRPEQLVKAGYKGRKNNNGFYIYDQKSGKRKGVNTDIYDFFEGRKSARHSTEFVQLRMTLAMVNEACWCLQEGIIQNPSDGDLGAVLGLGFPPFLGGPFRYIDYMGSSEILSGLESFRKELGLRYTPAPILRDYASKGKKFYSL